MPRNEIKKENGTMVFAGPDAVEVYRATVHARAIKLYLKSGMKPTRGWSLRQSLTYINELLGTSFKRGQAEEAAERILQWGKDTAATIQSVNEVLTQD